MNVISNLRILNIRTEKSNFEWNKNYSEMEEHNHELSFTVGILVNADDEQRGIIRLGCDINHENKMDSPFTMEVIMMGEFQTSDVAFKDYIINAVSLLFPYLRTHISTITSISGVEPLIIPAINIYKLLEQNSSENIDEN